jgi:arylsulfatase/arylsulfatase A
VATTPFLERFAERATSYRQARSPSNWSLPAHASLFTGHEAAAHRMTVPTRLDPGHTVFERLAEAGYATGVFSSNLWITDYPVGLGDAFETVVGIPDSVPSDYEGPGELDRRRPTGFYYGDEFLSWVDGDASHGHDGREAKGGDGTGPWAACVNLMDAHEPYQPLPAYDEWGDEDAWAVQAELGHGGTAWKVYADRYPDWYLGALERLYRGGIRQADAIVEAMVRGLERRGVLEDTLVVVTSDHGEGFGEPSAVAGGPRCVGHTVGADEAVTHVPLVVSGPGQRTAHVVDDLATLTRFPAVVRAVREQAADSGNDSVVDPGLFAPPDGTCTVFRPPLNGPKLETGREMLGDGVDRYVAESRAVYRDQPGRPVERVEAWKDAAARVTVYGAGAAIDEGPADAAVVADAVDLPDPGILSDRPDDPDALPKPIHDHLADLGYL